MLLACRPCAEVQGGKVDTLTIKETVFETDTVLLTDSALISLFYECNSEYEIIAKDYDSLQAAFNRVPKAAKIRTVYKTDEKVVKESVPVWVSKEKIVYKIPWYCWVLIGSLVFCLVIELFLSAKILNKK